jgi:hypothetical protein
MSFEKFKRRVRSYSFIDFSNVVDKATDHNNCTFVKLMGNRIYFHIISLFLKGRDFEHKLYFCVSLN